MSDVVITVRGEHEVRVAPERAIAHLTIRTEGPERSAVVERIASLAEPVKDDLISRQTAGTVVEWTSQRVAVWSERPWNHDGKRLAPVHYASVDVTATFSDFAVLSWWASEVIEREGVQFGWIDWQLTPQTRATVERDAATEAVRVAMTRADAYAAALGLEKVAPLEVADVGLLSRQDRPDTGPQPMMARTAFATEAAGSPPAVQLQPDDIVVSAGVEARFVAR